MNAVRNTLTGALVLTAMLAPQASAAPTIPISGPAAMPTVATGVGQTCIVNGSVRCLGGNWSGQLGPAASGDSYTLVPVTGIADAIQATAAWNHTCALHATGKVSCWGQNDLIQLGDGTISTSPLATPIAAQLPGPATQIAAGSSHTCAIMRTTQVACWGWNAAGQLGDPGGPTDAPIWAQNVSGAVQISAGYEHTCAVISDGNLECWGGNGLGQLGDPDYTASSRPTPAPVPNLKPVRAVAAGNSHTCAVTGLPSPSIGGDLSVGGAVKCWGLNTSGQLGDGTTTLSLSPVAVSGLPGSSAVAVTAGTAHTCALIIGGAVYCWGDNAYGQLGDGTNTSSTSAVKVQGLSGVYQISAGSYFTCAMTLTEGAKCWGQNYSAQLGDGTHTNSNVPVSVVGSMQRVTGPIGPPVVSPSPPFMYKLDHRWFIKLAATVSSGIDDRAGAKLMTVQVSTSVDRPSDSQAIPRTPTYASGVVAWGAEGVVSRQSIAQPRWVRVGNRAGKWTGWLGIGPTPPAPCCMPPD